MKIDQMKKAFTLAELLITLTIIFIIAIMTLPGILKATKEKSDVIDMTSQTCICK